MENQATSEVKIRFWFEHEHRTTANVEIKDGFLYLSFPKLNDISLPLFLSMAQKFETSEIHYNQKSSVITIENFSTSKIEKYWDINFKQPSIPNIWFPFNYIKMEKINALWPPDIKNTPYILYKQVSFTKDFGKIIEGIHYSEVLLSLNVATGEGELKCTRSDRRDTIQNFVLKTQAIPLEL